VVDWAGDGWRPEGQKSFQLFPSKAGERGDPRPVQTGTSGRNTEATQKGGGKVGGRKKGGGNWVAGQVVAREVRKKNAGRKNRNSRGGRTWGSVEHPV